MTTTEVLSDFSLKAIDPIQIVRTDGNSGLIVNWLPSRGEEFDYPHYTGWFNCSNCGLDFVGVAPNGPGDRLEFLTCPACFQPWAFPIDPKDPEAILVFGGGLCQ